VKMLRRVRRATISPPGICALLRAYAPLPRDVGLPRVGERHDVSRVRRRHWALLAVGYGVPRGAARDGRTRVWDTAVGEVAMKLHIRYDVNGAPVGVRCYCAKCTMHGIWNRRYAILYGAFLLAGALVAAQIAVRVVMFVVSRVR
jgi:hypothetical protein